MKREVIFRGWSPIQGKWIYGSGVHSTPFRTYLLTDAGRLLEVEPETVGEWTGLHSNTGRKIFEGDVVKIIKRIFLVRFCEKEASFMLWDGKHWCFSGVPAEDLEIVGNIFDDEDLKKKYWEIYQK